MISHTVRVFKLMYIVAGILISNEEICDTVDRIQIAPRVEMKSPVDANALQQRALTDSDGSPNSKRKRKVSVSSLAGDVVRGVTSTVTSRVGSRFGWLDELRLRLQQWHALALSFTVWTIPNLLLEYTSSYIGRKLFMNSDCDMIYK
ncbi:uncharacterized protein LOC108599931 [Drosophila busckii]|uniref:uncharacterized protein LOC108599931 n=1 Tax=Drosophila busckii TaxID=30019 RepID=UPI00083EE722|nr:uncharacterized protein LOC108599931 [Drosophila busckii]